VRREELSSRNVAYGYDNDYRLTSEAITNDPAGNNGTVSYVYDPVGNRFSMTSTLSGVPGGTFSYVFPLFSYVSIASQSLASPFGSASG